MDPRKLFADERLQRCCIYCGCLSDTREHVPSRILLDDPLPADIPTVAACAACNGSYSLDEEYFACFLECVICGTTHASSVMREKVARALAHSADLAARILASSRTSNDGTLVWLPEEDRLRRVVIKLAQGHAACELGLPQFGDPAGVTIVPLATMSHAERIAFESSVTCPPQMIPEVGSRAFHRAFGGKPYANYPGPWIVVQEGRYRYSASQNNGVFARIVLSEYLGCTVQWE